MAISAASRPATRALRRPVAAPASSDRVGPWSRRQCQVLAAVHVLVLLAILGCYWKSSGLAHPATQLTWLNLSVVALGVACGADWLFFTRGHRRVSKVRNLLFVAAPVAVEVAAAERLVAVEGARRFHLAGCAFVVGKPVAEAPRSQHDAAGRVPCEVCRPGGES
jgi:hypothetical protein